MRGRERGMEGQPVPLSLLRPMHSHNGARYRRISHQRQKGSHSTTSMAECHTGRAIRYHKDAKNGCRYNIADKNYGAVAYSRKLFTEQCLLHLEVGKGTYCKTVDQTREDILEEVLSRLRTILIPFKKEGMGWAHVAESILRDSSNEVRTGRLCTF